VLAQKGRGRFAGIVESFCQKVVFGGKRCIKLALGYLGEDGEKCIWRERT
jgi:hypothetical protein